MTEFAFTAKHLPYDEALVMLLLVFALFDYYIFLFIRLPKGDFKFKDKNKRTGRATPRKRGKVSVDSSRFFHNVSGFVCFLSLLSSAVRMDFLKLCKELTPSRFFPTFGKDQWGKIIRHHWKRRINISKLAKFESDRSKASEDLQSCKNLQTIVPGGGQVCNLRPYKCL